jgi:hypothetical protein
LHGKYNKAVGTTNNKILNFYHLSSYFQTAIFTWFKLRNKFHPSIHVGLGYIKKKDLSFYKKLNQMSKARNLKSALRSASEIEKILDRSLGKI